MRRRNPTFVALSAAAVGSLLLVPPTSAAQTGAARTPTLLWSMPGDASAGMVLMGNDYGPPTYGWLALTDPAAASTAIVAFDVGTGTTTATATQPEPGYVRSFEVSIDYDEDGDVIGENIATILEVELADGRTRLDLHSTSDDVTNTFEVDAPAFRDVRTASDGPSVGWVEYSDSDHSSRTGLGLAEFGFSDETPLGPTHQAAPVVFSRSGWGTAIPTSPADGIALWNGSRTVSLPAPAIASAQTVDLVGYTDLRGGAGDEEERSYLRFLYQVEHEQTLHLADGNGATLASTSQLGTTAARAAEITLSYEGESVLTRSVEGAITTFERWNVAVNSIDTFVMPTPSPPRADGGILAAYPEFGLVLATTGTEVQLWSLDGGPTNCTLGPYDDAETFGNPNHYSPANFKGQLSGIVRRSYLFLLDREPGPDALVYWTNHLARGGSAADITASIRTSDDFASRQPSGPLDARTPVGLLSLLCDQMVSGVPTSIDLDNWLQAGASYTADSQVVSWIHHYSNAQLTETTYPLWGSRANGIWRLYQAYFQRDADTDGLNYWNELAYDGMALTSISAEFEQSPEFTQTYGALNDRDFVELLYHNVFDRAPDADGWDYWVRVLEAGNTRGTVMLNFSNSVEFILQTNTLP